MSLDRRQFLYNTAAAGGLLLSGAPGVLGNVPDDNERILVVVELSGGNDGLNCVVPYADDAYYRHRPTIGIKPQALLPLDDHFGFNPGMLGFQRLWQSGDLAIVHGCGYDNPSFSHFTSMAYWHTASPNGGDEYGWMGRLADRMHPAATPNSLINIGSTQSLAVKSRYQTPVVFDDPERFRRDALRQESEILNTVSNSETANDTQRYLNAVASSALQSSSLIRRAWSEYSTPVDYGIAPLDLPKVAACIATGLPTRLYHVAFRNNSFDTHVQQPALQRRLLSYACDGIHGFIRDMERLGMGDRVSVMVHSEFGRRVPENSNLGTDHGSANVVFFAGKPVVGGHYGKIPSLTNLTAGDNLLHTTDFRRVYATAISEWLQQETSDKVLKGAFEPLRIFG
ncbi:MAG: DUF1501 domain-containing protein [Halioglobus sp.]